MCGTQNSFFPSKQNMIHLELAKLLKSCKGLTQSQLAQDADVNRGQFNAWLKTGNNLADHNAVAVIDALLVWLDKEGEECKTRHLGLINSIKAFPPFQAVQSASFPMLPVPAGHSTYIERATENQLARLFEFQPADVAIVGGPKMGKTSLMNWLQHHLRHKHYVLRCDFRNQSADILRAIEQSAKAVGLEGTRLRTWTDFPEWARRTLLAGTKACTLMLDHVQNMDEKSLRDMQAGLHYFVNQRRQEPVLDRMNLVLVYDEAAPLMLQTRNHDSGMVRELKSLVLAGFDEGRVEALLRPILNITNNTELETFVQTACESFCGHPFLTHLWADSLADQKGSYDAELALQNIAFKADEHLFRPFLGNLDLSTRTMLQSVITDTEAAIDAQSLTAFARLCLRDSGLFAINGLGAQTRIEFASPWIRTGLAGALATKD